MKKTGCLTVFTPVMFVIALLLFAYMVTRYREPPFTEAPLLIIAQLTTTIIAFISIGVSAR